MASSIPIKYKSFLNRSIWPIYETLTGTTTSGQSGPGSNGNEGVFHTTQISRTGVSPSDVVWCYTQEPLPFFVGGVLLLCRVYSQNILTPV